MGPQPDEICNIRNIKSAMKNRDFKHIDRKNVRKCVVAILCMILVLCAIVLFTKKEPQQPTIDAEQETATSSQAHIQQSSEQGSEVTAESEPETVCPEPEYPFRTEEITLMIEGIEREYTIAWVSDLHLVSDHAPGDKLGDVHAEYLDAIEKRYEELAVTPDGVHAQQLWADIIKYLNCQQFDGVLFGGDIMDYCSNSNLDLIKEGLDKLNTRYMYIRADHDYGAYYGGVFFEETEARELHQTIDGDEISHKFWDMGDFLVLGIDSSTKDMPEYYLNMVSEVLSRGKPVILATHVPYASQVDDSLAALSMQVRSTIYYWSSTSERYNPNLVTQKYLDQVYAPDTAVVQVLAGHLHASWDGMLSEQTPQHIFAPAFGGTIGIVHIVPK